MLAFHALPCWATTSHCWATTFQSNLASPEDTLVFLICLMSWGGCLFPKGDRKLNLFCFTLTVWNKCLSVFRRRIRALEKTQYEIRQIGHTTSQYGLWYGQSSFPKTISAWNRLAFAEAPSLAVFRSNFL